MVQQLKSLSSVEQAVFFHSRERRRSLAGVPELFRTHQIFGVTEMAFAPIPIEQFPDRNSYVTFRTSIRVLAGTGAGLDEHRGMIFEFGSNGSGVAAYLADTGIGFHAGPSGDVTGANAVFDNGGELPEGLELDLTFAVKTGNGKIRIYGDGNEIARAEASSGGFGVLGRWAQTQPGSFATAVQGATVIDVPTISLGAPSGFEVIEPLSVYVGSVPQQFV